MFKRTKSRRSVAVIDTNVMLDLHSVHDLRQVERIQEDKGDVVYTHPQTTYRAARARDALLLAMLLSKTNAATWALHNELVTRLLEKAPPLATDERVFEATFTTTWIHFVHPKLFAGWWAVIDTVRGTESSDAADRAVVDAARDRNVPLISAEGLRTDGTLDDNKLVRAYAKAQGVTVLTPRQFYRGRLDEGAEIRSFFRRFDKHAPAYVRHRRERFGDDGTVDFLQSIHATYQFVLLGKADDGRTVRVTLPEPP